MMEQAGDTRRRWHDVILTARNRRLPTCPPPCTALHNDMQQHKHVDVGGVFLISLLLQDRSKRNNVSELQW